MPGEMDDLLASLGQPWAEPDRVNVDYAPHSISISAVEEICVCGGPATHKIGDQSGPRHFHELTRYLCCKCMFNIGMNCGYYPPY